MEPHSQTKLPHPHTPYLPPLPNATTILVLGIISIAICGIGLITGIIALVLANKEKALYLQHPNTYSAQSFKNINTGRICAIIGIALSSLLILFYIVYIILIIGVVAYTASQNAVAI